MSSNEAPQRRRAEFPTLAVAFAIYAGFIYLTLSFHRLPPWLGVPLCAVVLTWYGSLQHEAIHEHPTGCARFNTLLAFAPLSLWIPYARYRETHLAHHAHHGRYLTELPHDPESFYLPQGALSALGPVRRALHGANCTLLGRMVLGPAVAVLGFWAGEVRAIRAGDRRIQRIWALHVAGVAAVLLWIVGVCHLSPGVYLLLVVYPSIALTHLRSYAEHRAELDPTQRTRVVETNPLWSLLFLNNNLHIAHHAHPQLPWYRLPGVWRRMRTPLLGRQLIFGGYREVIRRHLLRPYVTVEHPLPGEKRPW